MRLSTSYTILFASCCWAAQWAIDPLCNRQQITLAFQEALHLARNAIDTLDTYHGDTHVESMKRYIMGSGTNVNNARLSFEAILQFRQNPSAFSPYDDAWRNERTNHDVEIYCSSTRTQPHVNGMGWDRSLQRELDPTPYQEILNCHNLNIGHSDSAITTWSDYFDMLGHIRSGAAPGDMNDYMTARPRFAYAIDICAWYLRLRLNQQPLNQNKVVAVVWTGFNGEVPADSVQADELLTLGGTILHELCHTMLGGRRRDVAGDRSYGWQQVGQLRTPENADNIMWLAIAMKLFTLGYWIDDSGVLEVN
ncbi:hypothetical protein BDV96DRAFT_650879 [Lophiotrema nucula]|uniref:Lysine-specific metallo-endopeptidase domain-containing protein n=1 Tax=Lophiotrema nucula TaxID=690887 RepID=A0A6A5YXB4_9PLEO|nr:hypothetical protein BDV96DRAFT_650879 [Lophiotrema nucula]